MSVDVFGRQLSRIKSITSGGRGPPGEGFKITADGQYDIDNRRLCNVAAAIEQHDAVSVEVMRNAIQEEVRLVYAVTSSLRDNIDDHEIMFHGLETQFQENIKRQRIDSETVQELITRNSQLIAHLEETLRTFEKVNSNDDSKQMIHSLESRVKDAIKDLGSTIKAQQEFTLRNSQIISQLNDRLVALEHGESSNSRRAS